MEKNFYFERRQSRSALYNFLEVWRPRLKKMGLSLTAEQSDLLRETSNLEFRQERKGQGFLFIRVGREGQYEGLVSCAATKTSEAFAAEILGAQTLEDFLATAHMAWTSGGKCGHLLFAA